MKNSTILNTTLEGDVMKMLKKIDSNSVDTCITSPPYWMLRDYGIKGQIGMEPTPELYVKTLVRIFKEVYRVLKPTGTLWLNLGDTYCSTAPATKSVPLNIPKLSKETASARAVMRPKTPKGLKPKDLVGIPWRVALALQKSGWYLRSDIIWNKPNPMPESVTDRPTRSHEYIFLLSKSETYFYDAEAIKTESIDPEDNRGARGNKKRTPTKTVSGIRNSGVYPKANKRSVWTITTKAFPGAHFATFPQDLINPCVLASTSRKGNCAACGKPYTRVLQKVSSVPLRNGNQVKAKHLISQLRGEGSLEKSMHTTNELPVYETKGWKQSCTCKTEVVQRPVVLDCFAGSHTTPIVASKNECDYIAIELNPEYIKLGKDRMHKELGIFQ